MIMIHQLQKDIRYLWFVLELRRWLKYNSQAFHSVFKKYRDTDVTSRLVEQNHFSFAGTVQIKPQTTPSLTGQVQNLQIIQGPQGQLQVRGLLPGKHVHFEMPLQSSCILFISRPNPLSKTLSELPEEEKERNLADDNFCSSVCGD